MTGTEIIFGIHAVQALLKSSPHRLRELMVLQGRKDQRIQKLTDAARTAGVRIKQMDRKHLDQLCESQAGASVNHQGVVAIVLPGKSHVEADLYELIQSLRDNGQEPFILVLDGVTDPHNLGACMRSADAAGVHAVVIPKDNSAGLNETARKVASGAGDVIPLIPVTNLARSLKKMQELGLWITGAAGEAEDHFYSASLTGPRVIVMGAEGSGMRRLTRETCDNLVKIPMLGTVSSLNVSVATGIILFEVVRQRLAKT